MPVGMSASISFSGFSPRTTDERSSRFVYRNLVQMHIELLRQIGQPLVALQRNDSQLNVKFRRIIPSLPSRYAFSLFPDRYSATGRAKLPLSRIS